MGYNDVLKGRVSVEVRDLAIVDRQKARMREDVEVGAIINHKRPHCPGNE